MKRMFLMLSGLTLIFSSWGIVHGAGKSELKITILYDNYLYTRGTKTDWGFSCLIEGTAKTILFDTGTKSEILHHNIKKLGVNIEKVEIIAISHNHGDHTGGLFSVLEKNNRVSVYMPASTGEAAIKKIETTGAAVFREAKPKEICKNVYLSGEMGDSIKEQALVINSSGGLIVLTGCAHPGVVKIVERAKEMFPDRKIQLVFGGFHLMRYTENQLKDIINRFRALGVKQAGPTHCTGDKAIKMFKDAYGKDFVRMGVGKILEF